MRLQLSHFKVVTSWYIVCCYYIVEMETVKDLIISDIAHSIHASFPKTMKVWKAWRIMKSQSENFLPVDDNGQVIGIVSSRELQIASNLPGNEQSEIYEVLEIDSLRVSPDKRVLDIAKLMANSNAVYALVESQGVVLGVVSCFDIIRVLTMGYSESGSAITRVLDKEQF